MLDELIENLSKMSEEELKEFFKDFTANEMFTMLNDVNEVLEND